LQDIDVAMGGQQGLHLRMVLAAFADDQQFGRTDARAIIGDEMETVDDRATLPDLLAGILRQQPQRLEAGCRGVDFVPP
jgi:hypothetical protein